MKTFSVVSLLLLCLAVAAAMFCVNLTLSTCPDVAWCAGWVRNEQSRSAIAGYGILAVLGFVVLLVIVAIYGRGLRGKAFNSGPTISQYYEASKPMLWGALFLYYTLNAIAWGSLNSKLAFYSALFFGAIVGVFSLQTFVSGLWNFLRWLMLEAKGIEWGTTPSGGNALFRVIYRRPDGSLLVNLASHAERSVEELDYGRHRRATVIASIIALIAAIVARPSAYQSSVYLGWALTYLVLVPLVAKVGTDLIYTVAYKAGAQFIPGAKVLDAPPERMNASLLNMETPHGDASFETVSDMVRRMRGKDRR
jgi:hypothetical protein